MKEPLLKAEKKILICLTLCSFWVGLDLLIISPLIPSISTSLNFPIDSGGLLIASYALIYAIAAPIFGPFSDRWGRKTMILSGLGIFSLGAFLTLLSDSLTTLLLFRGVSGIGAALIMPSVYALVGDTFAYANRGKVMGIVTGAMGGASVLGIPLGSFLVHGTTWKTPFVLIGSFTVILILLTFFSLPNTVKTKKEQKHPIVVMTSLIRNVFTNKSILFALLCTLLWWAGFQGMFANMGVYYFTNYETSTIMLGLIFSFTGIGNVIGNIVGGRISDVIGKRKSIIICCVTSAIAVLSIPVLSKNFVLVLLVHFIWSLSTGFGQASLTSFISELHSGIRGTVLSLNSSATYLGMSITTTASTFILEKSGFPLLGIVCALAFLIILPIILVLVKEYVPTSQIPAKVSG